MAVDRHSSPNLISSRVPPRVRLKPLVIGIRGALAGMFLAGEAAAGELPVPKANFAPPGQATLDTSVANTLTINQQVARATLNWQSFNIAKGNTVRFAQPSAQAIALNRIAQSDPSKILGQLKANGQVYLINQNGFVFGKDSQVNVNTLVASTLDISDDTFQRGITKVVGQDGRAALVGNGQVYLRDADGNFVLDANGKKQKIGIDFEPGAKVTVDKSGRIIAAAPKVVNQGELTAPDGQILLVAASDKVYLQEAGSDSPFRGLMVEVGSGGEVQNLGKILAERGNVTLMGFAVNQNGRVSATTSVRANGSVRLLAREGAAVLRDGDSWILQAKKTTRTADAGDGLGLKAKVSLGQDSLTEASPDLKDTSTAVDGQAQDPSYVEIMGKNVVLEKGATLRAFSGRVKMTATETPDQPGQQNVKNDSRLYIDQGAVIDVSGIDKVSLPMERNVVSVELRSNELRDSPLQRNGILYGKKIDVDVRKGTPIADIQGALDRIERTVRERSTLGGILDLISEGDAVIRHNALLNFAGGSVIYRPGYIKTTQLAHDRQLVDIGNADPNVKYDGIVTTGAGKFESGYVDGKSAGKLNIKANALALEAEINGAVKNGAYQRDPKLQASAGSLNIDLARTPDSTQAVIFQPSASTRSIGVDDPFPNDPAAPNRPAALILTDGQLRRSAILNANIATAGKVEVQAGESLQMPSGGSLSLSGGELAMNGEILAHAGNVKLATKLTSSTLGVFSGAVELGPQARIDASGAWVNDRPAGVAQPDTGPIWINGGKVSLGAQGDVKLKTGSLIDVSGGGRRQNEGTVAAGDAGDIKLEAALLGGSDVSVGGKLQGYALSGGKGGSLSLISDNIVVGAGASPVASPNGHNPLVLAADFFGHGGFANYSLSSNQSGLTVTSGTHIDVSVENRVLNAGYPQRLSGSDIRQFSHIELLPALTRPAGQLSLALVQKVGQGGPDAAVNVEKGAVISTSAGGSVNLSSDNSVLVDGTLNTPAGQINVSITPPAGADSGFLANQGIWLGQHAQLNAKGVALVQSDALGNRMGKVLSAGQVSLHADRGFIIAQPGSLIDVSGTQAVLDITTTNAAGAKLIAPKLIPSAGGTIELRAAEGIQLQGALQGKAGEGGGAAGGTLAVELDPRTRAEPDQLSPSQTPFPKLDSVISLSQSATGTLPSLAQGQAVAPEFYGQSALTADQVERGGFDGLKLRTADTIAFNGDVNLHTQQSIVLDARTIAYHAGASGGGAVSLESPYVGLGSTQSRPGDATSLAGSAVLKVKAGTLDLLGTSALQGFGQADLASSGDLRLIGQRNSQLQRDFLGEFLVSGDLALQASRIYPTTLSNYRVAAQGGQLNIKPAQTTDTTPPLSAGGKLTLEASNIVQGGVVEAPLGTLVLKASDSLQLTAGSLTSNSANGAVIPFGRTQGGLDWIYPLGGQNLVFSAPPEKKLVLEGKNLNLAKDSVVNTSGGGDLYAFEFVPGPGGSADLLNPSDPKFLDGSLKYRQSYAVLPDFKGSTAPYDPLEFPASGLKVGDSVYLSGGGGLSAGNYLLLPAHYALLPGAFLVTPESGTTDLSPGQRLLRADGASIVAGYRSVAGTNIHDARWSGFAVESGKTVRQRAEYQDHQANDFYAQRAADQSLPVPTLPRDAGTMRFTVTDGLSLDGKVSAEPAKGGLGGSLDIEAERLAILARSQAGAPVSGAVNLIAENLNQLGVRSIVLGGVRQAADGFTTLDVKATKVSLEKDAQLSGSQFILLAKDQISLAEGSQIKTSATQASSQSKEVYKLKGDAAYLNVSSNSLAELDRSGVQSQSGAILVDSGATLSSSGSITLDASTDARINGTLDMKGGALALGASRISVGDGVDAAGGLVLTPTLLQNLKVDELVLSSATDIGLFGPVSLNAKQLSFRSGGLLGFANAGGVAQVTADSITLENPQGSKPGRVADGSGRIDFTAKELALGQGNYRLDGFSVANFNLSGNLTGTGAGNFTSGADLNIKASELTGGRGADTVIDATGHAVSIGSVTANPAAGTERLGARLSITADSIAQAGRIVMPSGVVTLDALQGKLTVDSAALIDVSGRQVQFGNTTIATDGGQIILDAAQGDVNLQANARLDLHGEKGGTLAVAVPNGGFQFSGQADAHGTASAGSFRLDTQALDHGGDLGELGAKLSASGFDAAIQIRSRTGDMSLSAGEKLTANSVTLAADSGSLAMAGVLNASGAGAELNLSAGQTLRLADSASLKAQGSSERGGKVLLQAVNPSAGIEIGPGAKIDLASVDGKSNGILELRAARVGKDVAVSGSLLGAVKGAATSTVEAVKTYASSGVISSADIATYKADTDAFMVGAEAIENRLGLAGGLRPGVEIVSTGNLSLGDGSWDLLAWRYGGRPGVLSLRAGNDLNLNQNLSDGFKAYDKQGIDLSGLLGTGQTMPVTDMLQPGLSWSYRLSAGRDVTVGPGVMVRTGTGAIDIGAGRDFVLSDAGSVLYTAGRPTDTARYGSFKNSFVAFQFYGEYPVDGGRIDINAGRDVRGALTGQFFDGWLTRTGEWSRNADHSGETPTSWAVSLGTPDRNFTGQPGAGSVFRQNLGSFGGGDVNVHAGGDVTNLSVMMPTTGKQTGTPSKPDSASDLGFSSNSVTVSGGGKLSVAAGGDVIGGVYYTGSGSGAITAAGAIKGSQANAGLGPVLALGDSTFRLDAGGDIALGAAINPTVLRTPGNKDFFFTYSNGSGIELRSLSGKVTVQNDLNDWIDSVNRLRPLNDQLNFPGASFSALSVYPASLNVQALQGDIELGRSFVTYPSAKGRFDLFAGGNIVTGKLGDNVNITQSDADPTLLPSVDFPATSYEDAAQRLQAFGDPNLIHAQTPVHSGDSSSAHIHAQNGGILPNDPLLFNLATPVQVNAATDIVDASFKLQHSDYALSSVTAGRDIRFTSPRNAQGNLVNLTRQIELAGPGQLWVSAGRTIDLGASEGIYTIGNTFNRALAAEGASISVLAGLTSSPQFDQFAKTYDPVSDKYQVKVGVDPDTNKPIYVRALTAYMRKRTGDNGLDDAAAAAAYRALASDQQREFLLTVLFSELRAAASQAAKSGKLKDYQPGYQAIDTLFPGAASLDNPATKYKGDLKLFFSKIHTVSGGDINLLVPGGLVNAGLAVAFSGSKPASDLGIVAQRDGAVNALVDGNFQVNQSRVFAMDGGDISVWSSNGNIDAGRGAKAAIAAPPPLVTFDAQGNLQVVFPPVVSGSGIRTAASSTGVRPGDVYLAAPRGVVDAGEAGIGANNITIAATAVIGASNISVSGTSTGVPSTNVAVPVAPASAANAAANAAQTAQQSAGGNAEQDQAKRDRLAESARLTPLNVEVVGFGACSLNDVHEGKPGCS